MLAPTDARSNALNDLFLCDLREYSVWGRISLFFALLCALLLQILLKMLGAPRLKIELMEPSLDMGLTERVLDRQRFRLSQCAIVR